MQLTLVGSSCPAWIKPYIDYYVPCDLKDIARMTRLVRKYTKEFKQEAVQLALKSSSISDTAKELDIPAATLHTWIHDLKKQGKLNLANEATSKGMAALIEENRRLHKELSIAKEEKEILKKAAAYFAQHQK